MKLWLLFVFDLGVAVCVVRAAFLARAARKAQPAPAGHQPSVEAGEGAWLASQVGGWIVAACVCAFAAFLAAIAH
jgi:hypothetical protein